MLLYPIANICFSIVCHWRRRIPKTKNLMGRGGGVLLALLRHLPLPVHDPLQVLEEVGLGGGQAARAQPRVLAPPRRQRLPGQQRRRLGVPVGRDWRHPHGGLGVAGGRQIEGDTLLGALPAAGLRPRVLAQVEGDLLVAVLVRRGARVAVDLLPGAAAVPQHGLALQDGVRGQLGHLRRHARHRVVLRAGVGEGGLRGLRRHRLLQVPRQVVLHLLRAAAARRQLERDLLGGGGGRRARRRRR